LINNESHTISVSLITCYIKYQTCITDHSNAQGLIKHDVLSGQRNSLKQTSQIKWSNLQIQN